MTSAINAAMSGLQAYSQQLQKTGNNIANLNTESFKKDRVLLSEKQPEGVSASVEKVDTPGPLVYEETSEGYELIEQSNVDLGEEIPDMINSVNAYKANLKTLQAEDEMADSLLNVKA